MQHHQNPWQQRAFKVLKQYYGYDSFRPGQGEMIRTLMEGRDALAVMPTGAGKSLCFQVPALLMEGITLVVSPLVSLMKDQVMTLVANGVAGAYLNSSLNERQMEKAIRNAAAGKYKIIYVAPERLLTKRFQEFVQQAPISMVAVDEAHCVSQLGQDFRPSYLDILPFLEGLPHRPVVGAFTATATPQVKEDIIRLLGLISPQEVTLSFDRPNLFFRVMEPKDKKQALWQFISGHEGQSGIVYCATRRAVEEVAAFLSDQGISAAPYHGGMEHALRAKHQEEFLYDRVQVMVATNAFGMGIDKPNVRFVVHYQMPKDMESYYQEAGRAGRDGQKAWCLLLYQKKDVALEQYLLRHRKDLSHLTEEEQAKVTQAEQERLKQMVWYCKTKGCLREYILEYFGQKAPRQCSACGNCLHYFRTEEPTGLDMAQKKAVDLWQSREKKLGQYEDHPLFLRLKEVRKTLAHQAGVPAFVIFSDRTLEAMTEKMPQDRDDLLHIPGVGQKKLLLYGDAFLQAVRTYLRDR